MTRLPDRGPAQPSSAALEPGALFDRRYVIDRELGRGGMGVVYRAKDNVTGDAVCIKLVHPSLVQDASHAQRFLREGKLTRSLRHRNIVSVFDVNVAGGAHYLSMECIEGESLRAWLTRNRRERRTVPLGVAVALTAQIADGLAAAHAEGVVHRDLKPENVMLLGDPLASGDVATNCRVKVLDFGIARALASREALTMAGGSMGTPAYMAPEQETGADSVGPEADVYSLGAIFYEILLGVPPRGRFEPPSRVRVELPAALDEVCDRALSPHPSRRFPGAREFAEALQRAVAAPAPRKPDPPDWLNKLSGLNGGLGNTLGSASWSKWPKSSGQWVALNALPCLAWVAWLALWWRTRSGRYLAWAALYSLPFFGACALSAEYEAPEMTGYTTGYDAWGNPYQMPYTYSSFDEEAVTGYVVIILAFWVGAIVHALRTRPLIDALNADGAPARGTEPAVLR